MKVYIGSSYDEHATGELLPHRFESFRTFYSSHFKKCQQGTKVGVGPGTYFTIAKEIEITPGDPTKSGYWTQDHFHRYDKTQLSAQFICYDGDSTIDNPQSCIPFDEVKSALDSLNYQYILYTSHSHNPPGKHRWRLIIPCVMGDKGQLVLSYRRLLNEIRSICPNLGEASESSRWSQPWYFPNRDNPDDGLYRSAYSNGRELIAEKWSKETVTQSLPSSDSASTLSSRSQEEMVSCIVQCKHPVHESIRDWIKGSVCDTNRQPGTIVGDLMGMTAHWTDSKYLSYRDDLGRQVEAAVKKYRGMSTSYSSEQISNEIIYTKYPDLGGNMEKIVQECMSWMMFPNRQIAVTAARCLISAIGSRVYTLPSGKGINLTALLTGRSTIGKSNVKKFFIWVANNSSMNPFAEEYLGAQLYTSAGNLIEDLRSKIALFSVRTESGHSDKSTSGDMKRVMQYELEFSTEGGIDGFISKGGQNKNKATGAEILPALYSPGLTSLRESVAEIQNDADMLNKSTVAGVMGRRSIIIIDPEKSDENYHIPEKPSKFLSNFVRTLHNKASIDIRKDCTKPLSKDHWIFVESENLDYFRNRKREWIRLENAAARIYDHTTSTFYGRLYERVPAFAAMLAIADDPDAPTITDSQFMIAEECLCAEFTAVTSQDSSGIVSGSWGSLENSLKEIFSGDMERHVKRYDKKFQGTVALKELKDNAIEWTPLSRLLQHNEAYKQVKNEKGFNREFEERAKSFNIVKLSEYKTMEKYGHKRITFMII